MCVFICMYLKLNHLTSRTQSPPPIPSHFLGSPCLGFFLGIPMESPSSCLASQQLARRCDCKNCENLPQRSPKKSINQQKTHWKICFNMWHVSRVNSM